MSRYTIDNSAEAQTGSPQIPEYNRKGRFSVEEPSQFKRKGEIAAKSFGRGAVKTGSLLFELIKKPFTLTPESATKRFEKGAELAKELEEKFNLTPPEAETAVERMLAKGSEGAGAGALFGPTGMVTGFTGGTAGQGAREIGFPEPVATGVDILTGAVTPTGWMRKGTEQIATKTAEQATRKAVAEAEKLPIVRGTLQEPSKLITPALTPRAMKKFETKIDDALEKNIDHIMEESLLGKQLEKQGTIIGDLIEDAYAQTLNLAEKNTRKINLTNTAKYAKDEAKKIRKSAPSLATSTQEVVKKLEKYASDFGTTKGKPTYLTAKQLTGQWKEINKDLNSLYAKTELTGAEELYRQSLENMKQKLLAEADKQLKDPALMNSFRQQNKLYHEGAKFDKAKAILEPVLENGFSPSKFRQIFKSDRKFSDLKKALGNKNAHRLRDISKYYVQPIEQLKKSFEVKSLVNLEDLLKGFVVKKLLGLPIAIAWEMTPHAYGKLLASEKTQNLWVNLMRAIKDGSVRGVEKYADALEEELSD